MVVRCPGCAKQIDESAWRCPHCARDFQGDNPMSRMPKHAPGSERPTGARTHSGPRTGRPHGPARGLPRAGGALLAVLACALTALAYAARLSSPAAQPVLQASMGPSALLPAAPPAPAPPPPPAAPAPIPALVPAAPRPPADGQLVRAGQQAPETARAAPARWPSRRMLRETAAPAPRSPARANLSGVVVNLRTLEPASGAALDFIDLDSGRSASAAAAADGSYSIALEPSAQGYRLEIRCPGFLPVYEEQDADSLRSSGEDVRARMAEELASAPPRRELFTALAGERTRYDFALVPVQQAAAATAQRGIAPQ